MKRYETGLSDKAVMMHGSYALAKYPGIEAFVRQRSSSKVTRLDGRSIKSFIEAHATADDLSEMTDDDRALLAKLDVDIAVV